MGGAVRPSEAQMRHKSTHTLLMMGTCLWRHGISGMGRNSLVCGISLVQQEPYLRQPDLLNTLEVWLFRFSFSVN